MRAVPRAATKSTIMWLPKAKVGAIAEEMVRALTQSGDVETESPRDMRADLEAVLNQYVDDCNDINQRARDLAQARQLGGPETGRLKAQLADQRGLKLGEDSIDYLLDQLLEMLMHSHAVEEVYAADHELRLKMRAPLRKQFGEQDQVEAEVRGQLKHVQEGSALWEVEYQRLREQVLRRKGR